ncbi:mannitol dehydrogenase family protein [uncultured Roseibium sp.]|uniref:mannitol dehydrogenase family protein n=1 Tax=uncultured Roseibium sp. TaxID=1936171 RepID=UPI00262D5325|nr:mannitol dehydrogenase family protein [uncultured Roseibium sp.]
MSNKTSELERVTYDRTALRPRLLHIGFGAFAKAHVMVYHDEWLRSEKSDCGVVAVRLHSGEAELTKLDRADGLFAIGEMQDDDLALREIGPVVRTLHPKRDGISVLIEQIADPRLTVITLTITEKGYCLSEGHLDLKNAAIAQDLTAEGDPTTAIGIIATGLQRRMTTGCEGLTILSCDNLPANGKLCRQAILEFAERLDPALSGWIERTCRFPCSMVDRITPAMTEASHQKLEAALGHPDPNGILCEPFRQWVIEDSFAGERPGWDQAGAQFVSDVAPFEDMKLRLLNGSHSFLAYLGALAGKETISDCMADPVFKTAAKKLMLSEQAKTLEVPPGVDIPRYADALIERFSNSALHHKTTQIASDGSQKLPQRLLAPISWHIEHGSPFPLTALGVAGWMHYCRGLSETGMPLPLNDPLAAQIEDLAARANGADYVEHMLSLQRVFGEDLPASAHFTRQIRSAYDRIGSDGVVNAITASL